MTSRRTRDAVRLWESGVMSLENVAAHVTGRLTPELRRLLLGGATNAPWKAPHARLYRRRRR